MSPTQVILSEIVPYGPIYYLVFYWVLYHVNYIALSLWAIPPLYSARPVSRSILRSTYHRRYPLLDSVLKAPTNGNAAPSVSVLLRHRSCIRVASGSAPFHRFTCVIGGHPPPNGFRKGVGGTHRPLHYGRLKILDRLRAPDNALLRKLVAISNSGS